MIKSIDFRDFLCDDHKNTLWFYISYLIWFLMYTSAEHYRIKDSEVTWTFFNCTLNGKSFGARQCSTRSLPAFKFNFAKFIQIQLYTYFFLWDRKMLQGVLNLLVRYWRLKHIHISSDEIHYAYSLAFQMLIVHWQYWDFQWRKLKFQCI